MRPHRAHRWLAGSAVAALAALTVVSGPAGAAPGAEDLQVFVPSTTLTPNGPLKSVDATIFFPDQDVVAHTVTFDLAGVSDLAAFTPVALGRHDCTTSGTTISCVSTALPTDTFGMALVSLNAQVKPGVTPGASGAVKVTVTASGGAKASTQGTVRIGEGVDLAVGARIVEGSAQLGEAVEHPVQVTNAGTPSVEGAVLLLSFTHATLPAKRYDNCLYSAVGLAACTFTETLAPGQTYTTTEPYRTTVAPDTWAPSRHGLIMSWFAPADWEDLTSQWWWPEQFPAAAPGNGGVWGLVPAPSAQGVAPPQSDLDLVDNDQIWLLAIDGDQRADFAAVGTTISGAVGTEVKTSIGVENLGPAEVDFGRTPAFTPNLEVTVPDGVTVTAVDDRCAPLAGGQPDWDNAGKPGLRHYWCAPHQLIIEVDETISYDLTLRIDTSAGATGPVVIRHRNEDGETGSDLSATNDTAAIVVNGGGSGSLPVTGARTAALAGAGGLALALGVAVYLLARRRRLRFTA
jgi:LPXTG-motif cell wall-anchored protein